MHLIILDSLSCLFNENRRIFDIKTIIKRFYQRSTENLFLKTVMTKNMLVIPASLEFFIKNMKKKYMSKSVTARTDEAQKA